MSSDDGTPPAESWRWSETTWRGHVDAVRAGRRLVPDRWPGDARVAVAVSFDSDHETIPLRDGETSPGRLAQGEYGARTGAPRILDLLAHYGVPATFFMPAVSALLHREEARAYTRDGHELAVHGWIHERNMLLGRADERELTARALDTLTTLTGQRPQDDQAQGLREQCRVQRDAGRPQRPALDLRGRRLVDLPRRLPHDARDQGQGIQVTRHVLLTGAAGGIGSAIAEAFAAQGTFLTLSDRDHDALRATATRFGDGAAALAADLTGPRAATGLVEEAWKAHGPVDVLVNAAGSYPSLDMAQVDAAAWDRLFALNLRAPVLTTAALARLAMAAGRPGSVVNISSGSALRSRPGGGPYASSKAALEMATRAAALELGVHAIRVNAVSPGFVLVDSDCNPVSAEYAEAIGVNPLGRPGTPEDVARAVCWIAGPEASWITGEVLRVDGGSSTGALHLPRIWQTDGTRATAARAPLAAVTTTEENAR